MLLFLTVLVILSFLSFQYFEKVFYKRKWNCNRSLIFFLMAS
jgi:hypothetical protein